MAFDPNARTLGMSYPGAKRVTEAVTLAPNEVVVRAIPAASNYNITLPPVHECVGRIFSIVSIANAAGTITVVGDGSEAGDYASPIMTITHDRVLVMSDGEYWHTLASDVT